MLAGYRVTRLLGRGGMGKAAPEVMQAASAPEILEDQPTVVDGPPTMTIDASFLGGPRFDEEAPESPPRRRKTERR